MEVNRINDVVKKMYPRDFSLSRRKKVFRQFNNLRPMVIPILCLTLFVAIVSVFYYNKLIMLYTDAVTAEAQIKTHLQKRGNIVTNLTKMVSDYAEHERTMHKYTADVRKSMFPQAEGILNAAQNIKGMNIKGKDFSSFESVLSKFMAWSESYPELKLSKNFQDFMREIVAVETNIADARILYNDKVNKYTSYRSKIPNKFFAWSFGFGSMDFYQGSEELQKFKQVDY